LQRDLTAPPVPSLDHTFDRFLEYASVIAQDARTMDEVRVAVADFRATDAPKAQQRIEHLAARKDNWVRVYSFEGMH
jgi:hypothetical protein